MDGNLIQNVSDAVGGEVFIGGLDSRTQVMLFTVLAAYILVILGIGWWSCKKVQDVGDYLVAGRRLGMWMATGTLLATWFGAGSSMGVAAQIYSRDGGGLSGIIADPFGASISLILAGIFIVGLLRKKKCLTVTDIIERRFGAAAGIYASIWMLPVYIGWLGAQIIGMGTILYVITGISIWWGILVGACVILVYTFAGGMWAVTLTDIVQVSVIVVGLCLLVPQAVSMAGGWDAVFADVPASDLTIFPASSGMEDFTYRCGQWIVMGLGCMVGQDLIQRSLASRNPNIAISSSVLSGFFYMALAVVPITIGFAARVVFAKYGITEEVLGDNLENQVLPRMAILGLSNIHPIIMTVFIAALISAIMSSADSSLLAASSLLSNNIIKPLCKRITNDHLLTMTRFASVVLIVISAWLAMEVKSIYSLMINSWSSQLVVVFLPVIAALYFKRVSRYCVWACMVISPVVWIGYTMTRAAGYGLPLSEVLSCERLDYDITVGAVYGFAAGVVAFLCAWLGETITGNGGEGDAGNHRGRRPRKREYSSGAADA